MSLSTDQQQQQQSQQEQEKEDIDSTPSPLLTTQTTQSSTPSIPTPTAKKKEMSKDKVIVTMYGIIRGPAKCQVCTMANQYFSRSDKQLYFKYNHVNATKPVARTIAKKEKISEMPYFRYKTPEDLQWKFIVGWNEQDFEEMIPMVKNR